jgi:hypothetical protein
VRQDAPIRGAERATNRQLSGASASDLDRGQMHAVRCEEKRRQRYEERQDPHPTERPGLRLAVVGETLWFARP